MMTNIHGSHFYLAPEVIEGHYDQKCDLWSLGVITYALFTKAFPFYGKD